MVLSTEWSQVEVIDLINDGSGLGFGIVGGRSTGVVVKSILPGGIADRDGRLQSGDHILQVGDVHTRGLASEHVATVLRQSGIQVRLVVARPVEPTSSEYRALGSHAPIVPTKTLTDPDELETLLLQNGYPENFDISISMQEMCEQYQQDEVELTNSIVNVINNPTKCEIQFDPDAEHSDSPESEQISVTLQKNAFGLGITVAGYVWEREELSGIFVKGISEGSAAHLSGKIHLNDRIVEVDGKSLLGFTNHEAVELLRKTGPVVQLSLERYLRGPRYEHLQNALQAENVHPTISPPSPSVTTLSWFPVQTDNENPSEIEPEPESHTTIDSTVFEPPDPDTIEVFVDTHFESGSITPDLDEAVKRKWECIVGTETEIVVTQLRKLRGLGISLEGTVDVEDGIELRPRHFIRSILPEGPVGLNGKLSSGDELLEVNGQKLWGKNHVDVVKILKELPETVRMVCARNNLTVYRVIDTAQDREAFAARNILGGSLRNLLNTPNREITKTQSDGSINTSSTATIADETIETCTNENDSRKIKEIILVHKSNDYIDSTNGDVSNEDEHQPNNPKDDEEARYVSQLNVLNSDLSLLANSSEGPVEYIDASITEMQNVENLKREQNELSEDKLSVDLENSSNIGEENGVVDLEMNEESAVVASSQDGSNENGKDEWGVETRKMVEKGIYANLERRKSRSLETITYLAIWKNEIEYTELVKDSDGLGFAILDYQDPLIPNGIVIVVRSLVSNGSAELDGKLKPGDRLMSVNDISLKNVSLDAAVRALKGAPLGKVRIGFSKPIPLSRNDGSSSPISINDEYFIW